MLGNVYIKEKEIYLYYDDDNIGKRTGMIYQLGYHLTNFTWFDIQNISDTYTAIINFILVTPKPYANDNSAFYDMLSDYIDRLDNYYPYLHFYTQALIKLLLDYPKIKSKAIDYIKEIATDSSDKINNIYKFLFNYDETVGLESISSSPKTPFQAQQMYGFYLKLGNLAKDILIGDINIKRDRIVNELQYITDEKEGLKDLNPKQRVLLLDFKKDRKYYTANELHSKFLPDKIIPPDIKSEERLKQFILEKAIDIVEMYQIDNIDDLIRFELLNLISSDILIKECQYCGYFFVPKGRTDTKYCDRINVGEEKPCNEIGAMKVYKSDKIGNPINELYQASYNRFYSRVRTNKMKKNDFRIWSEKASALKAWYIDAPDKKDEFSEKLYKLGVIYDKKTAMRKK